MPTRATTHSERYGPNDWLTTYYKSTVWKATRLAYLANNRLCIDCKEEPATDVHHIVSPRVDRTKLNDTNNFMALCHSCHSRRTARGE